MKYSIIAIMSIVLICSSCSSTKNSTVSTNPLIKDIATAFLQEQYDKVISYAPQLSLASDEAAITRAELEKAQYYVGLSYLKLEKNQEARTFLEKLRKRGSRSFFYDEVELKLAALDMYEGKNEEAMKRYQSFVEERPESQYLPVAYYWLGKTHQRLGHFADAKKSFTTLKQRYPMSFEAKLLDKTDMAELDYFTVQVGAFYDYDNADQMLEKLKEQNYDASVLTTRKEDGSLFYRVRVGKFASKAEAAQSEEKLKASGYQTVVYP